MPVFLGIGSFLTGRQNIFIYITSNIHSVVFYSLRQLTFLSIPELGIKYIFEIFHISLEKGLPYLFVPIIVLYFFATIWTYKRETVLRLPILTSLLFLPIVFILNIYMRVENVNHLASGSRYLFAPSIGYAIFWAIFIVSISRKIGKWVIYATIIFWFIIQFISINREIDNEAYKHTETKKIIAYIKTISPKLKDDSIVVTPKIMGYWGTWFCKMYYGKKNNLFIPSLSPQMLWVKDFKRPFNPKTDFIVGYDEDHEKVVDITKDYEKIILNNNLN